MQFILVLKNPPGYVEQKKIINYQKCQSPSKFWNSDKFKSFSNMSNIKDLGPNYAYQRVNEWIKKSDFENSFLFGDKLEEPEPEIQIETNITDKLTDITSVTKEMELKKMNKESEKKQIYVEKCEDEKFDNLVQTESSKDGKVNEETSLESISAFVQNLKNEIKCTEKVVTVSPWTLYEGRAKSKHECISKFSPISESDETVRYFTLFFFFCITPILSLTFYDYLILFFFSPY